MGIGNWVRKTKGMAKKIRERHLSNKTADKRRREEI